MLNLIIKTVIIYIIVIFIMRLMGKKQAGELQPYEFVITLLIAEMAGTPMNSPGTPMIYGIAPALTLLLMYYLISLLTLKSRRLRWLICGHPSILIHNGRLNMTEIRRQSYNLSDLLEQLRAFGQTNISDIRYAILETNGNLSVMPYADRAPVTARDMGVAVEDEALFTPVILDGRVAESGLTSMGIDREGLSKLLHTVGFGRKNEIFLMLYSRCGTVFIQDKHGRTKSMSLPGETL